MKRYYIQPRITFQISTEHAADLCDREEFAALMFLQRLAAAEQFREAMGARIFRITGL